MARVERKTGHVKSKGLYTSERDYRQKKRFQCYPSWVHYNRSTQFSVISNAAEVNCHSVTPRLGLHDDAQWLNGFQVISLMQLETTVT